tara:strand:- start:207 stop:1112 length:906 start_codon:yes stop_codon:yes gene_type:complete
MKCAIIGSTKIAEVHAKHLIANGVREITFISRSHLKREKIILNVKRQISKRVLFFHGNIKELKKKNYDIICICSSTEVHDLHLRAVTKLKSIIIIEKPIISLLKLRGQYQSFLSNLYKKKKRIVVCYPYLFLAKSFKRCFVNTRKIKNIIFEFQSGGKTKYKNICVNLMPHALSFFKVFLKENFLRKNFNKVTTIIKKNLWQVHFIYNKINIHLIFKVNYKSKTSLKIAVNDLIFTRKTLKKNNNFINYIENFKTGRRKNINNPIGEFYKDFFKNINNLKYFQSNRKLTLNLMKKNYFFLK